MPLQIHGMILLHPYRVRCCYPYVKFIVLLLLYKINGSNHQAIHTYFIIYFYSYLHILLQCMCNLTFPRFPPQAMPHHNTDDSHNHCLRGWIILSIWSQCNVKCASQLLVVEIFPFLSVDLSFNMTQLCWYKLVLGSTYLKVNCTYFKTKYIITCPPNIFLVNLISQSYQPPQLFRKYIVSYLSTVSQIDTLSNHIVGLHNLEDP